MVLVNTSAIDAKSRSFAVCKAVKVELWLATCWLCINDHRPHSLSQAFTDSLLDLILSVDDSVKNLVHYYGKDELIYLGPDEQVRGVGGAR